MPVEIEARTATPDEHRDFVARIPEFKLLERPASCTLLETAVMINLGAGRDVFGGACYVPGTPIDARAVMIHLFGIFPKHRPAGVERAALSSLEDNLKKSGVYVALALLSTDGFRGIFQQAGYAPVGNSGYHMRVLMQ